MSGEISSGFAIYATRSGPVCVNSSIRLKILSELSSNILSLTDLCRIFDKPQSSMSVIMNSLQESGLVSVRTDENDVRRKLYTLISREQITFFDKPVDMSEVTLSTIKDVIDGKENFFEGVMISALAALMTMGLNMQPLAKNLGMLFGNVLSESIGDTKIENVIKSVSDFYGKNNVGKMSVVTMIPLTIKIEEIDRHVIGTSTVLSSFTQGIIKSIFESRFGRKYNSRSIGEADINDPVSTFVIEPDVETNAPNGGFFAGKCPVFMK